jgi:hypothetical protein
MKALGLHQVRDGQVTDDGMAFLQLPPWLPTALPYLPTAKTLPWCDASRGAVLVLGCWMNRCYRENQSVDALPLITIDNRQTMLGTQGNYNSDTVATAANGF